MASRVRSCATCGALFTGNGSYCPIHAGTFRGFKNHPPNPVRRTNRWRTLAASLIVDHVADHGWTCPGLPPKHAPHPSRDLTVDHIVPLSRGGDPFDRANLRILCRGQNLARNAQLKRGAT